MKQKLFIIVAFAVLGAVLIGLNMASYTQKPKLIDNEIDPNRSSFNSGVTGTQAFYSLLAETGRKAVRWQEPPDALLTAGKRKPAVFVVVGRTRREFTDAETTQLLGWVRDGGRLVLIDREPPEDLVKTTSFWKIALSDPDFSKLLTTDTTDQTNMTKGVVAARPGQPTVLTARVNSIQPSVLASDVTFRRLTESEIRDATPRGDGDGPPPVAANTKRVAPPTPLPANANRPPPLPPAMRTGPVVKPDVSTSRMGDAPVAHFVSGSRNIVVDMKYGSGTIVLVSDPYIVSNAGISLVDNAQLAINLVATPDGIIAFDEYHQGYGANNRFVEFFAGTPVIAIFFQCLVLVGVIFYSQSRRFARPVPEFEPDRLSKLEYVSAMAELQQRTRAFDLAIENIYRDFRRRASRLLGLDNQTVTTGALALAIAERTSFDRGMIESTLDDCDQIIYGEPTNKREVLALTKQIREFEDALGLRRRPRG